MAINKAEQQLPDKLINDLTDLKRDMREIKSKQPVGGDILQVQKIPAGTATLFAGPLTIAGGGNTGTFIVTFVPDQSTLTLWNTLWTLWIDVVDNAHQFPQGSSLDLNMRAIALSSWWDWADSSDTSNIRVFKIHILNNAGLSHDYYVKIKAYIPQLSNTSAS